MSKQPTSPKKGAAAAAPAGRRRPERDETDTFFDEVNEELRRDETMALARRYGPIAAGVVVLVVLAAAVYEYIKASEVGAARAAGGQIIAASEAEAEGRAAALIAVAEAAEPGPALIARLQAAEAHRAMGDLAAAGAIYEDISNDAAIDPKFRDLAALRGIMAEIDLADPMSLVERLDPLSVPGAPFRALALELRGTALAAAGDIDGARRDLQAAASAEGATQNLARRASTLLETLGGPIEDVESSLIETNAAAPASE